MALEQAEQRLRPHVRGIAVREHLSHARQLAPDLPVRLGRIAGDRERRDDGERHYCRIVEVGCKRPHRGRLPGRQMSCAQRGQDRALGDRLGWLIAMAMRAQRLARPVGQRERSLRQKPHDGVERCPRCARLSEGSALAGRRHLRPRREREDEHGERGPFHQGDDCRATASAFHCVPPSRRPVPQGHRDTPVPRRIAWAEQLTPCSYTLFFGERSQTSAKVCFFCRRDVFGAARGQCCNAADPAADFQREAMRIIRGRGGLASPF